MYAHIGLACRIVAAVVAWLALGGPLLLAQEGARRASRYQDLLEGYKNPARWLTFSGDYSGQRHSPLKQITPDNAHRLAAQWTFQTGDHPAAAGSRGRRSWSTASST